MVAFAFQREVFDDAEIEIVEGRLSQDVAWGHGAVEYGAVVPIVRVALGVEADDGCVGCAGVRCEERVQFEADRKVEDGVQVEGLALIEIGIGALC